MFSPLNVTPTELWQMPLTHLWLSGLTLLTAVAIAVPVIVLFAHRQRATGAVLWFTNVLQIIPSLALLGLLIPFVSIGSPSVLIALTLYTLLPIFQSIYLGLTQVDQSIQDMYTAFGLSRCQSLWRIELSIASSAMISGIRTAAVLTVGTTTLTALISADGLDNLILFGVDRNNMTTTFIDALPSALLTVGVGGIIGLLQESRHKLSIVLALAVGLGILGLSQIPFTPTIKNMVVASRMGSEPDILISMYKLLIERENSNVKITVKPNFSRTALLFSALNSGEIDIYPEFAGTVLEALVQVPTRQKDHHLSLDEVYQRGRQLLAKQCQLESLLPISYQNTYALAVKESYGASHQLKTISNLKQIAPDVRAGFSLEFTDRADGYEGMQAVGITLRHIASLEPALRCTALLNNKINLVEAFFTDAELKQYQLRLLKDDTSLFPAYQDTPLMKTGFAEKSPQIVTTFSRLTGEINEEEMNEMNYHVKVQGENTENVARDYLEKNGLLGK